MAAFWVIGDIHGMFDPLKALLMSIYELQDGNVLPGPAEKIIFLGDYIDHGPSSKEVTELLMNLPMQGVFLAGNHDDFLLHFVKNPGFFGKEIIMSWMHNGGSKTLKSFFFGMPEYKEISRIVSDFAGGYINDEAYEYVRGLFLSKFGAYVEFFEQLVYGHSQVVSFRGKEYKFVFLHAGYMPLRGQLEWFDDFELEPEEIEEQVRPMKFEEYHRYWMSKGLGISDTSIWTRRIYDRKTGNYILVHGHTPVFYLHSQFNTKLPADTVFFNVDRHVRSEGLPAFDRLISIGLDTGAVYGYALTAMYVSDKSLENGELIFLSMLTSEGFRDNAPRLKRIKI